MKSLQLLAVLVLLVVTAGALSTGVNAQDEGPPTGGAGVWYDVNERTVRQSGVRHTIPDQYRLLAADLLRLDRILAEAPLERSAETSEKVVVLALPLPDGSMQRFRIENSPIMEAGLAERYPEIRTFHGQGLDDPSAVVRMDRTPAGFHAMILSTRGTVYIDPYQQGDIAHYISYFKHDLDISDELARRFENEIVKRDEAHAPQTSPERSAPSGNELRTYRLAMAATGEYTTFHGGSVPLALSAIVTTMNRVNAIYEREVAVRMILIANNDDIIYTDALLDPYTNADGFAMLFENQANLTAVIGTANYDIGHVFSTGGGGIASLGSVCAAAQKAQGVTGSGSPVGDPFDVDYVAHEIGHQFGAEHTFNGTTGACGGGNRWGASAFEPGSGSTIMAYAGICGAENVQLNSDDYFHTRSFDEIVAFSTTGGGNSCAQVTSTGNQAPSVNAGSDYTIPAFTPFEMTGSATDPDGDPLTYNWEQFNLGAAAPPNSDNGNRPIFRSFLATTSGTRTLPRLSAILGDVVSPFEVLPTTNRTLTFRLTARDNQMGGGGVNYDTAVLTVSNSAGPFFITAPGMATWVGNSSQTVTWDVANTDQAPVSCASVNIDVSADGGLTFPYSAASGTPNDGSQSITVPNISTTEGRVRVSCATSVFFDISDNDLTINEGEGGTATPGATSTATRTQTPSPTATRTATATSTATRTLTPSVTATGSQPATHTATATRTATATSSATRTVTPSVTATGSQPATHTATATRTATSTATRTLTPSVTATGSHPATHTATATRTATPTTTPVGGTLFLPVMRR